MAINLIRPLAGFDIESTGISIENDRIVELCVIKIHLNGEEESKVWLINPEMPIPVGATEVHNISDDDVVDKPTFKEVFPEIARFIKGCDLLTYNGNRFDIPLLKNEFARVGLEFPFNGTLYIDALIIYRKLNPNNLSAVFERLTGNKLENAHSAEADVSATITILEKLINKHSNEIGDYVLDLHKYSDSDKILDWDGKFKMIGKDVCFNFGKHKDKPVKNVWREDNKYINWFYDSNMPEDSKEYLRKALKF